MKTLDLEQTKLALPYDKLIDALENGFRMECQSPLRHHHILKNDSEQDSVLLLMPAWLESGFGGVKIVNVVPDNALRSLAAISSSYILFDRLTGKHLMLVDGGELTARRTAAASALAAKKIARADSKNLLVVGTGRVGRNLPFAYRAALPIEKVTIFNRNIESASSFATELRANGFDAHVVSNLEQSVREADIISCATLSRSPIIKGDWLSSGQHLDLIGSFMPSMREADDMAISKARIFIDTDHAMIESGDIAEPLANGTLKQSEIAGSLLGLCRANSIGRTSPDEITLFKSVGSAIEDLSAAKLAYEIGYMR